MRLLYFSESYTPHDHRLLQFFTGLKWQVEFCTRQAASAFTESRDWPEGVFWTQVGEQPAQARKILLQKARSCTVSLAGPLHTCAWEFSETAIHPWMAMSWAYDLLQLAPGQPALLSKMTRALNKADALFCDALAVRHVAERYGDWSQRPIVQFPWGVDLVKLSASKACTVRSELGWSECKIWICTRNWDPVYDPMTILRGFNRAVVHNLSLRLVLVGGGMEEQRIKDYIQKNDLSSFIVCPGRLSNDELLGWIKAADFYVSAARCDGSSVSMLEAMGCGLPVVVTDIPSNREWVETPSNGCLFPVGNDEELSNCILAVSRWPKAQLLRVSSLNQKLVRDRADWDKNAPLLAQALLDLPGPVVSNLAD